jgi:hypothetical protein
MLGFNEEKENDQHRYSLCIVGSVLDNQRYEKFLAHAALKEKRTTSIMTKKWQLRKHFV